MSLGFPWTDVPVDPSAPDARELLLRELSDPEYQAAQPTLLDLVGQAISDWLQSLIVPTDGSLGGIVPVVIAVLLVVGIVVAFLVWGVPRLNRRSRVDDGLFGAEERRSAAELRRDAASAAARGDYTAASLDAFRALARGLQERTVITMLPGTTAHEFARHASSAFPDLGNAVHSASTGFDAVRYAGATGTVELYRSITDLDATASRRSPVFADAPDGAPV
ncbi:DUF4129 domain-containing protein [Labedella phragmitis]|uniref:DUF4129 domain-containing protein n=1 Tax=Labedella phragmitis TaxID=2498849 RepID=A0A3S4AEA0_9MICO|nr:DUF4129 domain-containing protein [Labedella phragmitis]RWZ46385.1 DUF4129 domain-containing protein [Labedella phragmitis]